VQTPVGLKVVHQLGNVAYNRVLTAEHLGSVITLENLAIPGLGTMLVNVTVTYNLPTLLQHR
jgi:hypothetical protein